MTVKLPKLCYLDDRPVFPEDRRHANAYARGGIEEERKERDLIKQENTEKDERNRQAFKNMMEKAKAERKADREAKEIEALTLQATLTQENTDPNAEVESQQIEIDTSSKGCTVEEIVEPVVEEKVDEVAETDKVADEEEDCPPQLENVDLEMEREKKKLEWMERVHAQEVERAKTLIEETKEEPSQKLQEQAISLEDVHAMMEEEPAQTISEAVTDLEELD